VFKSPAENKLVSSIPGLSFLYIGLPKTPPKWRTDHHCAHSDSADVERIPTSGPPRGDSMLHRPDHYISFWLNVGRPGPSSKSEVLSFHFGLEHELVNRQEATHCIDVADNGSVVGSVAS
jgi:hypothetical protein